MQQRNDISSFDAILDAKYGAVGTAEREAFRKEATNYCVGQIILDARKQEHMTQSDLAKKVGTDKTYISRIEKEQKAENPTRRCVLRSGNNSNANSGLAYANANNASSNSNTNYGGRLKFFG